MVTGNIYSFVVVEFVILSCFLSILLHYKTARSVKKCETINNSKRPHFYCISSCISVSLWYLQDGFAFPMRWFGVIGSEIVTVIPVLEGMRYCRTPPIFVLCAFHLSYQLACPRSQTNGVSQFKYRFFQICPHITTNHLIVSFRQTKKVYTFLYPWPSG